MAESLVRYFRISSKDMVYLKFVLEAYEGLATMSTVDGKMGIIRITVAPGLEDDVDRLLQSLSAEIAFTELFPPLPLSSAKNPSVPGEDCHA